MSGEDAVFVSVTSSSIGQSIKEGCFISLFSFAPAVAVVTNAEGKPQSQGERSVAIGTLLTKRS
jgi:hypothetical protein